MQETLYLIGSLSAVVLVVGHAGWIVARLIRRAAQVRPPGQRADQDRQLLQDLSGQIDALRADIGSALEDVHERLDFAERVLAKGHGASLEDESSGR